MRFDLQDFYTATAIVDQLQFAPVHHSSRHAYCVNGELDV